MNSPSKMIAKHFEKNFRVFDYLEMSRFLQDIVQFFTASNQTTEQIRYSLTHLAALLGFKSAAHFSLILGGKRNMTESQAQLLASALGLNAVQAKYIETMALYSKEKSLIKKRAHLELLKKIQGRERLGKAAQIDRFLSSFSNSVAYELLRSTRLPMSMHELSEGMGNLFSKSQVKKSLEDLIELGLCESVNDTYRATEDIDILTDKTVHSATVGSFYCEVFDAASKAIMKVPAKERHYKAITVTVSASKMSEFEKLLENFSADVKRLAVEKENNVELSRVMQVNITIFPVTKPFLKSLREDSNEQK